jgi:Zn-finger nucleic acid-binding protein
MLPRLSSAAPLLSSSPPHSPYQQQHDLLQLQHQLLQRAETDQHDCGNNRQGGGGTDKEEEDHRTADKAPAATAPIAATYPCPSCGGGGELKKAVEQADDGRADCDDHPHQESGHQDDGAADPHDYYKERHHNKAPIHHTSEQEGVQKYAADHDSGASGRGASARRLVHHDWRRRRQEQEDEKSSWGYWYEALLVFRDAFGHCNVPRSYEIPSSISAGDKIMMQRPGKLVNNSNEVKNNDSYRSS